MNLPLRSVCGLARFSLLCLVPLLGVPNGLVLASTGCQAIGNVVVPADTGQHQYTQQPGGDRVTYFRVNRAIGSGEWTDASPVDWETYVANGTVSAKAAVRVGAQLLIDQPRFWNMHHLVNNGPMDVQVSVDFYFNGQPLGTRAYWHQQVTSAAAINVPTFYDCVTVPIHQLRFAQRPAPGYCEPDQGDFNCPGINWVQAKYTINVRQQLADLNINVFTLDMPGWGFLGMGLWPVDMAVDPTDGISVIGYANNISFDAQDPIILITGCCEETNHFWDQDTWYSLAYYFRTHHITFNDLYGEPDFYIRGTTIAGGQTVRNLIIKYARQFGADWVHLVAHSKGGLNARWVLGQTGDLESQNVGVRSLVTLDTPHDGSIAANYLNLFRNFNAVPGPEVDRVESSLNRTIMEKALKQKSLEENNSGTMADLCVQCLDAFNTRYPSPPPTMTVKGVTHNVALWALISDAKWDDAGVGRDSQDANGNYTVWRWRLINDDEARDWPWAFGAKASWILEGFYNLMGEATGVRLEPIRGEQDRIRLIPSPNPFQLNDGIVTVASQGYASHNGGRFVPFLKASHTRPVNDDNHRSVANPDIAQRILDLIGGLPPQ